MPKDDFYKDEPINRKQAVNDLLKKVPGVRRATDTLWDDYAPMEGCEPEQLQLFSLGDEATHSVQRKAFGITPKDKLTPAQREALRVDDSSLEELKGLRRQWKELHGKAKEEAFYKQAKLAERFEPEGLPAEPFEHYYPCYDDMTLAQLYSYFAFRAAFRRGERANVSTSYVFLLIYELLMLVGTDDAEEGWRLLCRAKDYYGDEMRAVRRYMEQWMKDFVVVNGLSEHIPEAFGKQLNEDRLVQQLMTIGKGTDEEMWQVFPLASSFNIHKSAFSKQHPDMAMHVAGKVMRALERKCMKMANVGYAELHLALRRDEYRYMYANAVAWKPPQREDRVFEVDSVRRYVLHRGTWKLEYFSPNTRRSRYETSLADILRDTDSHLRRATGFKPGTATRIEDPDFEQTVRGCIEEYVAEETARRKKEARDKVKIDFGKLGDIRNDAEAVKNALTVEDETTAGTSPLPCSHAESPTGPADIAPAPNTQAEPLAETPAQAAPHPQGVPADELPLAGDERLFLSLLLSHGDWKAFAKERRLMPSLLEESINNALFDRFADNVLEEGEEGLQVVEDYVDELNSMFFAANN